jgi:membrane associated rhomboid family serine protease
MLLILPIRTDRPRIRPAYLTFTLMAICTLVQIYSQLAPLVEVPGIRGPDGGPIMGPPTVVYYGLWGDHPTLLTFFTHMFVHGGWEHLIGNMLFLWIFGSLMEDALRPWGLAALYLGGGFMAALAHIGISLAMGHDVHVPMVGASGAIAAIMGLFMLRFYKTKVQMFYWVFFFVRGTFWVQSMWALAFWISKELIEGVLDAGSGVAHWAHVGGFLAGALAAPFLGSVSAAREEYITDDPETNVEYVKRGEHVAAAEKALRADPSNAYQMRRLAQTYRHAGEYERATETYQRCVYRFATRNMLEQAAEVYLELLDYNDGATLPPEILLKLGQQLETTHLAQAITTYRNLVAQNLTRTEAEYALLRLATIYSQSIGQPYEAARCLYEFLQRYPNSQWAGEARFMYDAVSHQLRGQ